MTAAEASKSPWSNVLYNALGAGAESVNPEVHKIALEPGDSVMLCSDGLYRHVRDSEIRDMLSTELEPQESCRSLIELANFRGGFDNITCIVARLDTPDDTPPKTRVAAEITLERMVSDTIAFSPQETAQQLKATHELKALPAPESTHETLPPDAEPAKPSPTEPAESETPSTPRPAAPDIADTLDFGTP